VAPNVNAQSNCAQSNCEKVRRGVLRLDDRRGGA
jgi:hypothetical protein